MSVTPGYRDHVLEQLGRVVAVTYRAMFGGVGIYGEGHFFALIDDDVLYFKVDDSNRQDFERSGKEAFRPTPEGPPMQYYELPGELLETPDQLAPWVEKSLAAARRKKSAPKRP